MKILEPAQASDREEIQNFLYHGWAEFDKLPSQKELIAHIPDLQNPEEFYPQHNGGFFVLRAADGHIYGTIGVHEIWYNGGKYGFLRRVFIEKKYRSQGKGTQALQEVENFCREKKFEYLMFGVNESMKRNKHFYKRNGYSEYTENIPPEISINHNTWYFKKKLL